MKKYISKLSNYFTLTTLLVVSINISAIASEEAQNTSYLKTQNSFLKSLSFYTGYSNYSGNTDSLNLDNDHNLYHENEKYISRSYSFSMNYSLDTHFSLGIGTAYKEKDTYTKDIKSTQTTVMHDHEKGLSDPTLKLSYNDNLSSSESITLGLNTSRALGARKTTTIGLNETESSPRYGYSYSDIYLNYAKQLSTVDLGACLTYKTTSHKVSITDNVTKISNEDRWLITSVYGSYSLNKAKIKLSYANYRPATISQVTYDRNIIGDNEYELSASYPVIDGLSLSASYVLATEKYNAIDGTFSNWVEHDVVIGLASHF